MPKRCCKCGTELPPGRQTYRCKPCNAQYARERRAKLASDTPTMESEHDKQASKRTSAESAVLTCRIVKYSRMGPDRLQGITRRAEITANVTNNALILARLHDKEEIEDLFAALETYLLPETRRTIAKRYLKGLNNDQARRQSQ